MSLANTLHGTIRHCSKLLLALLLPVLAAQARGEDPAAWLSSDPGPHAVGFRIIPARDSTRAFGSRLDPTGEQRADLSRPVPLSVWYPAEGEGDRSGFTFTRYVHRMLGPWLPEAQRASGPAAEALLRSSLSAQQLTDEAISRLLASASGAVEDAPPVAAQFPLIVVGQGLFFEPPLTHHALCEYLASHGYVVATCPLIGTHAPPVGLDAVDLETQVRDMEFVAARARGLPFVDPHRLGVIGFDLGGMAGLLMTMRNAAVDALVSLDSGIMFAHNLALLRVAPNFDPGRLCVPVFHATRVREENDALGVQEDYSLFAAATQADIQFWRLPGMRHIDFTSYALLAEPKRPETYAWLCRAVRVFLDAHVARSVAQESPPDPLPGLTPVTTYRRPEARAGLPREEDLVYVIFDRGPRAGGEFYQAVRGAHPDHRLFDEARFNLLGYQFLYGRGDAPGAIEIFRMIVDAYPQSSNAYDSLGEAYLAGGDRERAIANYRRSLELNPENENAARQLELLGQDEGR